MNCKNCGILVDGKYCSNCGQNAKVGRVNLTDFLSDVSENIFQINRGFFYTVKELLLRPGHSIREYLDGKRQNHFKPIGYVLALSTLYFLTSRLLGGNTWMNDLISGYSNAGTDSGDDAKVLLFLTALANNFAYSTLLSLPIFSLASYLSFRKFKTNYLEHIILNSYITGQQAIFYTIFLLPTSYADNEFLESIGLVVSMLYTLWVFWQFFQAGNPIAIILRFVLTYILYFIFFSVLLFILFTIYILGT